MLTELTTGSGINRRIVLFCGGLLFVAAFWMPAVAATPQDDEPASGWFCAWMTAYGTVQGPPPMGSSIEDRYRSTTARVLYQACWTTSGWISPLVAILLLLSIGDLSPRMRRKIAVVVPPLMVAPFGVFFFAGYHPVSGHYVWMAGSLLIAIPEWRQMFTRRIEKQEAMTMFRTID